MRKIRLSICLLISALMFGCSSDPSEIGPGNPEYEGDHVEIAFSASVPTTALPTASRAMTENEERLLNTIDILMFEVQGINEVFAYRTHNTNDLTKDGNQYQTIKMSLERSTNNEQYRIVILANLREEVNAVVAGLSGGELKEDVLNAIRFRHDTKWPAGTGGFRAIPMWGESSQTNKVDRWTTAASFGGSINLIRALASINVGVHLTDKDGNYSDGTDFFDLISVKVVNANAENYAAPVESAQYLPSSKKVLYPSVYDSDDKVDETEMTYILSDINPRHDNSLYNEIYVHEALNKDQDMDDVLYLIVKGFYTEPGSPIRNTTTPTYYRVDFFDRTAEHPEANRFNILRNHQYIVNINYIGGPGDENEDNARKRYHTQIKTEITNWSYGETTDVEWNGKYYLGVSQSKFEVSAADHSESFTVITNYPEGWVANVNSALYPWLTLDLPQTPGTTFTGINVQDELKFHVDINNDSEDRIGYIDITADNLTLSVKVTQHDKLDFTIDLLTPGGLPINDSYAFYSPRGGVAGFPFQVIWTPVDEDCYVTEWIIEGDFIEHSGGTLQPPQHGTIQSGVPGWAGYTIAPSTFRDDEVNEELGGDPFLKKVNRYIFTVGDSHPVSKSLTISMEHLNFLHDAKEYYNLGDQHFFTVRSNCPWTAVLLDNSDGMLDPNGFSNLTGGNNKTGEPFHFTTVDNPTSSAEEVTATIRFIMDRSIAGNIPLNTDVVIKAENRKQADDFKVGGKANCYVMQPGGEGIYIPVSQANRGGGNHISAGEQLDWKFIWTDNPKGMGPESAVASVDIVGEGPEAALIVHPGTGAGNAVVAVTNASGSEIYWSWHLWVSDFDPDDDVNDYYVYRKYKFLDRNLGALSEQVGEPEALGLYYQWGRKDPFPAATGIQTNTFTTIYNKDGDPIQVGKKPRGSDRMLKHSIQNPLDFITVTYENNWYHDYWEYYKEMEDFWGAGSSLSEITKGVYDPCPDGWMVVPGSTTAANVNWFSLIRYRSYNDAYKSTLITSDDNDLTLGYWPHSGYINNNGNLTNVGSTGCYWTANLIMSSQNAVRFVFTANTAQAGQSGSVSWGMPVRCMKRND